MVSTKEISQVGTLIIDTCTKNPNVEKDSRAIERIVKSHIKDSFCYMTSGIKVSGVKRIIGVSVKIAYTNTTPENITNLNKDLIEWGEAHGDKNGIGMMYASYIEEFEKEE